MNKTNCVLAKDLNATNIGNIIRFVQTAELGDNVSLIDGELRDIHHDAGRTVVSIGALSEAEYILEHDDAVVIDPPAFYEGDWVAELGLDGPPR